LSAGGHDEQPCEVNSSTTTGRVSAALADEASKREISSEIAFIGVRQIVYS
jgi:hypothetical protein